MGIFDGMKEAKGRFDANYIREGHYWMRIDRVKTAETRKREPFVAIEMQCIHVFDNAEQKGHSVGETCTHMVLKTKDGFLDTIKSFIANSTGTSLDEVNEEMCEIITGPSNPLEGEVVEVRARQIMTKRNTPFTQVSYKRPVKSADLEEILTDQEKKTFYPGNRLEEKAKAEAELMAKAAQ